MLTMTNNFRDFPGALRSDQYCTDLSGHAFVLLETSAKKCKREYSMSASQREKHEDAHIIALLELDLQKMRVRIVLAREAIRERMLELEPSTEHRERR